MFHRKYYFSPSVAWLYSTLTRTRTHTLLVTLVTPRKHEDHTHVTMFKCSSLFSSMVTHKNTDIRAKHFGQHRNMRGNPFKTVVKKKASECVSCARARACVSVCPMCAVRSRVSHGFKVEIIRFDMQLSSWRTIGFGNRKTRIYDPNVAISNYLGF